MDIEKKKNAKNVVLMTANARTIVWISRHSPLPSQISEIERLYGKGMTLEIPALKDGQWWKSAEDIIRYLNQYENPIAVCVLPLSMISHLKRKSNYQLLWAQMKRMPKDTRYDARTDTIYNGKHLRFERFKNIKQVNIELEDLNGFDRRNKKTI